MPNSPKPIIPPWIKAAKKAIQDNQPKKETTIHDLARWKKYRANYMANEAQGLCEVDKELGKLTDVTGKYAGALDHIVSVFVGGSEWDKRNHMMMKRYWHDKKRNLEAKNRILVETIEIENEFGEIELIPKNRMDIIKVLTEKKKQ